VSVVGRLATDLLAATGASRVTVRRADRPGEPEIVTEALAPGVAAIAGVPQPSVRAAATYTYLAERRHILVQDDCLTGEPSPPRALVEHFHVYAQMLAPVFVADELTAIISVHQQDRTRNWSADEIAALATAQAHLELLLSEHSWPA
jgi:GAF domain-containing protein